MLTVEQFTWVNLYSLDTHYLALALAYLRTGFGITRGPPIVPLMQISCNAVLFKSQNSHKAGSSVPTFWTQKQCLTKESVPYILFQPITHMKSDIPSIISKAKGRQTLLHVLL